jgi:transcriptional regulator with XRE-family HTH domain
MAEPITETKHVAERLRITRKALNLTQAELSRLTGISTSAWNNAETGDARIGIDNAINLCDATGVTLDWIFRGVRSGLPLSINQAIGRHEAAIVGEFTDGAVASVSVRDPAAPPSLDALVRDAPESVRAMAADIVRRLVRGD